MAKLPQQQQFLDAAPSLVQGVAVEGSHLHGLAHKASDIDLTVFTVNNSQDPQIRAAAKKVGVEVRIVTIDSYLPLMENGATWLSEVMFRREDILWRKDAPYKAFFMGHSPSVYYYLINLERSPRNYLTSCRQRAHDEAYVTKKLKHVARNIIQHKKVLNSLESGVPFDPELTREEVSQVWDVDVPRFKGILESGQHLSLQELAERMWGREILNYPE